MAKPERTLHGILEEAGQGEHVFGPPIHGVGIEFEEAPLPAGHAFSPGEKDPEPPGLAALQGIQIQPDGMGCGVRVGPGATGSSARQAQRMLSPG